MKLEANMTINRKMNHRNILKKIKFASLVLGSSLFIFLPLEIVTHIWLCFYPLHHEYEYFNVVFFPSILFLGSLLGVFSAVYLVEKIIHPLTEEQQEKENQILFNLYRVEYDNIVAQCVVQPFNYVIYFVKCLLRLL